MNYATPQEADSQAAVDLPSDLDEESKRQLRELGRESELVPAPFAIDESFVRHWCETLEDGNPLYLDEESARSMGIQGLLVPPAAVYAAVNVPFRWPWPPKDGARELIIYQVKRIIDLPVAIATDADQVFFLPVQTGDRVATSTRLISVSPWKQTRLGDGRFFMYGQSFWNEAGQRGSELRFSLFAYGRGATDSPVSGGGYSNAIEGAIEGGKTSYEAVVAELRYWEDIDEGDALPEIRMPINMTRCVMMASATRDFSPQHSNPEYAKNSSGARDVFVNTQFNMGMVSRIVTDWAGPKAIVRRLKVKMRRNICAGDEMIVTGRVARKYRQDGENRVDLDVMIASQEGPATPSEATVALPSRTSAKVGV